MDIRKHKAFLKAISLIVAVSFLSFDIAWAYPTRVPQVGQKLNVESPFSADFMDAKKKEFQESLFSDAKLLLSAHSIAKFLLEDKIPLEYLAQVLKQELKEVREGIDLDHVFPAEDGTVIIPYNNGEKTFIVQVARKKGLSTKDLAGYQWVANDEYVFAALPEGCTEPINKPRPEKEPEAKITEPVAEVETEIDESLDQNEPSKIRKFIIKAISFAAAASILIVLTPLTANAGVAETLTSSNIYSWLFYGYIFCFFHGFINMMIAHEGENFRTHGVREKIDDIFNERLLGYIFGYTQDNKAALYTGMLIFMPLIGLITIPITLFSLLNISPILKGLDLLILKMDERRLSRPFKETIEEMRHMSPSRILNRKGVLECISRCESEMAGCGFSIFEYDTQHLTGEEAETIADEVMKVTRKQGKIKKLLRKLLSNVVEEESKTHIEYGIYVHKGGPSDVGSRYIEDIEERVVDSKGEVKVVFDWAEFEMIKSKFRDKSALSETSPDNNERAAKKSRKVTLAGILESVRYLEKYHLVGWHIIRLGSNDYRVRDKAIAKLAKIGELAVKPLIRVLRHENVLVRIGAARALGLIGSAEAVDPLIDLLLMDKLSYFSAATALAAIGDRKALDPLIKTLGKCPLVEIPGVRNFIEKHANEDSVELLSEKLSDDNFDVKKFIIKLLRKIRDKRATKSLIDLVRNSSELGSVRAEAAKALLEIDDADVLEREFGEDYRLALKTYALISDNGAYVDEIIKIGRPAAPVLLSFLAKNCSRSYEPWVISTLGKIGGKGVFEALVASGKRDDWTLEALADLGDSRAVVILTEELIKEFEGPYLVHRVYTEHLRFHVGMGYAEALKPLIEHRDTLTGAYWKLAPVVIRKGDFEQIDLLREGLAMLVRQKLDEYTCANGTLEVDPPGKIVKLPEESYETIVSKLTDFAMKTGDAVALTRVMRSAVSVHHVLSKKYDFASPSEYGEIAIAVDWEKLEWSIRNEIAKAESARKEDAEGSDKDNTHAFKAQDGFNAAKISAVPFLIGIAGAVISFILNHGGFTWVTAAALVVGAYSGAAMLKYYFLGEQIHYRLARYFRREFAGLTADDAVVKAGKIMAEASLSQEERDEVWAFIEKHQRDDDFKEALAAVLGERIPIAKSDGYRHELFEKLPSTVQKQINIHEAFSHFWGMMRILPIISFFDGERHGSALKQIKQKKKDDAHPFAAKEGYKAAEITGLLLFPGSLFFLGAAGMVALLVQAQWNITGAVIAAGGVALYFGLASIKYYFISEEVHRGMKKYLTEQFGRWTESDVVAKSFLMVHDARFPKEEREKLLSFINKYRDNEDFKEKVADYLAGRLPVARSDGYRHPVFRDDLIPYLAPQIKTSINIHESFKSCFRGTISMLPVISLFYRLAWARKRRIMLAYASSDSCGRALEAANSDFEDARQEAFKNLTGMIAESPDLKATLSMLDTGGVRFRPSYEDAIIILKAVREAAPADIRRDILGNYANWGVEMIPEKLVEPQHPGEAPKEPKPGSVQSDASWTRTCMKYHEELAEYASRKNAYKKEVKVYKEEAKRAKKDFKTGELFIERRRIVLDLSGLEALSKDPERLKAEVLAWKGANPLPEDGREAEKDGAHSFRVMTGIKAGGVTGLMLLPGAAFIVDSLIAGHIGISAASIGTAVVTAFLAWSFGRYLLVADNVRAKMRIHLEGRLGKGLTVGDIRVRVNKMMYDASLTAEEQDKVRRFMDKHDGEDNFREKLISYLSYILPIARSNGYCLYIFDELPERTQRLIYIHETFKSCFWGTVAMLPIISLAFSDRIRRSKDEQLKYSRLDGDSQSTNANGLYRAALSDIPHISARAYDAIRGLHDVDTLIALVSSKFQDDNPRVFALRRLAELKDARAQKMIFRLFSSKNTQVREEAFLALNAINTAEAKVFMLLYTGKPDEIVNLSEEADVVPALLVSLRHKKDEIRRNSIKALEKLKDPRAIDTLVNIVEMESKFPTALSAVKLLGELCASQEEVPEEKREQVKEMLISRLGHFGISGSPDSLQRGLTSVITPEARQDVQTLRGPVHVTILNALLKINGPEKEAKGFIRELAAYVRKALDSHTYNNGKNVTLGTEGRKEKETLPRAIYDRIIRELVEFSIKAGSVSGVARILRGSVKVDYKKGWIQAAEGEWVDTGEMSQHNYKYEKPAYPEFVETSPAVQHPGHFKIEFDPRRFETLMQQELRRPAEIDPDALEGEDASSAADEAGEGPEDMEKGPAPARLLMEEERMPQMHEVKNPLFELVEGAANNCMSDLIEKANRIIDFLNEHLEIKMLLLYDGWTTAEMMDQMKKALSELDKIKEAGGVEVPQDVISAAKELEDMRKLDLFEASGLVTAIMLLARKAKNDKKDLVIGLETDWIPGMKEGNFQQMAISEFMREIDDLQKKLKDIGLENVKIVHEKSDDLAKAVLEKVGEENRDLSNVVVLGSETTINEKLSALRREDKKERPFLAGVDPSQIEAFYKAHGEDMRNQLSVEITVLMTLALELAAGKTKPDLPIIKSYDEELRTVILLLPKPEPVEYGELQDGYRRKVVALQAA